jgi:hypothetical protein
MSVEIIGLLRVDYVTHASEASRRRKAPKPISQAFLTGWLLPGHRDLVLGVPEALLGLPAVDAFLAGLGAID